MPAGLREGGDQRDEKTRKEYSRHDGPLCGPATAHLLDLRIDGNSFGFRLPRGFLLRYGPFFLLVALPFYAILL